MKLMTEEIAKQIPALRESEGTTDPMAYCKFFTPDSNWTWYAMEYDEGSGDCFGYVVGLEAEYGYFNLNELEEIKGPLGLRIERDIHFVPTPVKEIEEMWKLNRYGLDTNRIN